MSEERGKLQKVREENIHSLRMSEVVGYLWGR